MKLVKTYRIAWLKFMRSLFAFLVIATLARAETWPLDTSFGTDGVVITDLGGRESYSKVLIQPDGKILVAAASKDLTSDPMTSSIIVIRYNSDGSMDTSFGDNGKS